MVVIDKSGFRISVGIVLMNDDGKLFWGKRLGKTDAWQFPQGGLKPYETLEETMYRELWEEVGLEKPDVSILTKTRDLLLYKLPSHLVRRVSRPLCIGQKQQWFLLKLISDDSRICLDKLKPEFVSWRWVEYWYPTKHVVFFKKKMYFDVLNEFSKIVIASGYPVSDGDINNASIMEDQ